MGFVLIEIGRLESRGDRDSNLDRIVHGRCFSLIVDGYLCSEESLNQSLDLLTMNTQGILSLKPGQNSARMCIAGVCECGNDIKLYHKGDCRIYLQGSGLISRDNTLAWAQLNTRNIAPSEIAKLVKIHPLRDILSDHFTGGKNISPFLTIPRGSGNVMLCTDGFWSKLSEEFLLDLLEDPYKITDAIELASFTDNAACIILGC